MEEDSLIQSDNEEEAKVVVCGDEIKSIMENTCVGRVDSGRNELLKKYDSVVKDLESCQNEVARMHKILLEEVGSEEIVKQVLSGRGTSGGWKGRHDEICELRKKLRAALQSNTLSQPVSIVVDHRKTAELESVIEKQQGEISEVTRQKLALKSRVDALESRLGEYKKDVKVLLEKNEVNNRLISQLNKCLKSSDN